MIRNSFQWALTFDMHYDQYDEQSEQQEQVSEEHSETQPLTQDHQEGTLIFCKFLISFCRGATATISAQAHSKANCSTSS